MVNIVQKSKKFAFYSYTNPHTGKTMHDNMPWKDWERIMADRGRSHMFKLERMVDLGEGKQEVVGHPAPAVVEDPLECPLCGFVAVNEGGLRLHKQKKHQ